MEETPWREGYPRAILLISDAAPHPLGYTFKDYVVGNQLIDTVTITDAPWYKELSKMTNGISLPFASGHKTARLVEAATNARGSMRSRMKFDKLYNECIDEE